MRWIKGGRYEIIYLDQNNQISDRHIRVIQDREYILMAYCYERRGIRSFVKENILSVKRISTSAGRLAARKSEKY